MFIYRVVTIIACVAIATRATPIPDPSDGYERAVDSSNVHLFAGSSLDKVRKRAENVPPPPVLPPVVPPVCPYLNTPYQNGATDCSCGYQVPAAGTEVFPSVYDCEQANFKWGAGSYPFYLINGRQSQVFGTCVLVWHPYSTDDADASIMGMDLQDFFWDFFTGCRTGEHNGDLVNNYAYKTLPEGVFSAYNPDSSLGADGIGPSCSSDDPATC